jgi:uncharacterized protein YdaU (DUF1376 family)
VHFFTVFPDAWLVGTANLTTEESGAFWNLCCYYIAKDGQVPDDAHLLARVVKLSARRWGLVRETLLKGAFIEVRDGFIWQAKCQERLEKDGSFARTQRDKVEKRWRLHRAKLLKDNNSADTPVNTPADTSTAPALKEERKIDIGRGNVEPFPPESHLASVYRWHGKIVRLKADDYEAWRKSYSAIPDLDAELTRIDDALASEGKIKGWFPAASAMLAAKHQKLRERQQPGNHSGYQPLRFEG